MAETVRAYAPRATNQTVIAWKPQPGPQTALLALPAAIDEVFFGGARGGGKTDGMLGEWAQHSGRFKKHAIGVFFRKTLVQLEEAIERAKAIYIPLGAVWREQKKTFIMPGGARLKFRQLERNVDAEKYQGHSYTRVYFEELTNWATSYVVDKMRATLRSVHGVPTKMMGTGNPGGPGHQWVKVRYIDPAPKGYVPIKETMIIPMINPESGEFEQTEITVARVFIPSRVEDNKMLAVNDPMYIARLSQSGSENLVRAWLQGDWDVIEGAFFDEWRNNIHTVRPIVVPAHLEEFLSFDWGSAKPFSAGKWVVSDGTWRHPDLPFFFPRGALIRVNEWYGIKQDATGQYIPNTGLKLKSADVGKGIVERLGEGLTCVSDPAVFIEDGGKSHAERIFEGAGKKINMVGADNKRIPGWDEVRNRLSGNEDGQPMLYFFDTCIHSIRTLPALQHDEKHPEDVNTEAEDHAPDEIRYACMSRPYIQDKPSERPPINTINDMTMDDLWSNMQKPGKHKRI